MAFDRFMIAPLNVGLETDLKPWIIPDEAFAELNNAYIFRGRVRKRFGSTLMGTGWTDSNKAHLYSKLRIPLTGAGVGITDANGAATGPAGTIPVPALFKVGQSFSIGNEIFTINVAGLPANMISSGIYLGTTDGTGALAGIVPNAAGILGQRFSIGSATFTVTNGAPGPQVLTRAPAGGTVHTFDVGTGAYVFTGEDANRPVYFYAATATFNTTTGAFVFTGATRLTTIYFYPSEPVMGITQYESGTINNQPTWAFDTRFAYLFTGGSWARSGAGVWHGDNLDFFWATNWDGANADNTNLFVTNFQVTNKNGVVVTATDDPIWTYNGTTWTAFNPLFRLGGAGAGNYIVSTARIIVGFKDRLLLLNTIETDNTAAPNTVNHHYPNRCRYSHNGSPLPANTAWLEPNQAGADGAGWIDAPTEEEIVSAGFIKDRLIVYFERSTWELAYTGNQILPFVWQKINTELGSESILSTVPFDKVVLTIGNTGVHACSGANVERIDTKIPQKVFDVKNKGEGVTRTAGIRDYFTEMVYWTFPASSQNALEVYPNRVLVFNYKNGAWAFNDDCITAFGYFEQQSDKTWADLDMTWQVASFSWSSSVIQSQFRQVLGGNQQGYVFIINPDVSRNASVMLITDMAYNAVTGLSTLTIIDHTLAVGDFINIENTKSLEGIYKIVDVLTKDTVTVDSLDPGTYGGGGTAARVSKLGILSKQWNPYVEKGYNFHLAKIDFNVDKTTSGRVTVDYFPSYTKLSMTDEGFLSGTAMGDNILDTFPYALNPLEASQDQIWHPVYFQSDGNSLQIYISMNDNQMLDDNVALSGFELNAMVLYTRPTSTRL